MNIDLLLYDPPETLHLDDGDLVVHLREVLLEHVDVELLQCHMLYPPAVVGQHDA
jgi:hypothetical protein